jgi:Spy/CpxP family protein refolding chaperone
MKSRKSVVVLVLSLAMLAAAVFTYQSVLAAPFGPHGKMGLRRGGPMGHGPMGGPMNPMAEFHKFMESLDLTPEQKRSMNELKAAYFEAAKPTLVELKAFHGTFSDVIRADDVDEAAIRSAVDEASALLGDLAVHVAWFRHDANEILTDEQAAKVETFFDAHGPANPERVEAIRERIEQRQNQ